MLNIKIPQINLQEILMKIQQKNKYIIHIINIIYDPTSSNESVSANYYKTLIIDNCGDIYSTITMYYDYKNPSLYPNKIYSDNKKLFLPDDISSYTLPNVMIDYIKNMNSLFIFKTIDYTNVIYSIISKLKESSMYFHEFKQETLKNKEIISQKIHIINNVLDNEINDFKLKCGAHVESLKQVVHFLEHENIVNNKTLNELNTQNKQYFEINIRLQNRITELQNENENYKKKFNICMKMNTYYRSICNLFYKTNID
jgi:hypothetical protein